MYALICGSIGTVMGWAFLFPFSVLGEVYTILLGTAFGGGFYGSFLLAWSPASVKIADDVILLRFRIAGEKLVLWKDFRETSTLHRAVFGMFTISARFNGNKEYRPIILTRAQAVALLTHKNFPYKISKVTARSLGIQAGPVPDFASGG